MGNKRRKSSASGDGGGGRGRGAGNAARELGALKEARVALQAVDVLLEAMERDAAAAAASYRQLARAGRGWARVVTGRGTVARGSGK